ncbi:MAG TPA: hypothetical protein VFS88_00825 [Micavibrio sp.]|nr:hypothetical protein [Micavibrio sp.]
MTNSHIPDATDELGAVVTATAEATNKIMSVCEEIGRQRIFVAVLRKYTRHAVSRT